MCFVLIVASRSRASLLAAVVSAMAILLALRKLKTAAAIVTAQAVILVALFFYFPDYFKFLTVEVAHKGDATSRVLGSRDWVWEDTLNAIKESPWLGSGFGVSKGISEYWAGGFDSGDSFREQGNSYLGIVEYLGFVGTVPLALTLLCIGRGIFRCCFIRKFKSSGLAVVLAGILSASLVNVGFEAWLFAPGFYLAVVFWSSAFILDDLMESSTERSALNVLKETPTRAFGAFVAGKTV
jgi:O-antigen ligase